MSTKRLTGVTRFDANHIIQHRLSLYGPQSSACGKPLRLPQAELCAACIALSGRENPPLHPTKGSTALPRSSLRANTASYTRRVTLRG